MQTFLSLNRLFRTARPQAPPAPHPSERAGKPRSAPKGKAPAGTHPRRRRAATQPPTKTRKNEKRVAARVAPNRTATYNHCNYTSTYTTELLHRLSNHLFRKQGPPRVLTHTLNPRPAQTQQTAPPPPPTKTGPAASDSHASIKTIASHLMPRSHQSLCLTVHLPSS